MNNNERGVSVASVIWTLAGILVVAALGVHLHHAFRGHSVHFSTPYQAVLLTNGSVGYDGHSPVLTDVY